MMDQSKSLHELNGSEIAIIGMSCRFPGAQSPVEFWKNLCNGVESLTRVSAQDLERAGMNPDLLKDPSYVPMVPALADIEFFDASFFGYTPLEARIMDPQHRLFLECAWEAFEQAGYVPDSYGGKIGVFTGAKTNTYLFNLFTNREVFDSLDHFQIALGNDLACMATRVAYKFNLRGPSYAIHTACSTSLVAVHLACQSLLLGECDMALAGGAAINVPQHRGYLYQKGGILSPDGHCRTFDASAQGSNFGNGVGTVLIKRLEDALSCGDHIYAIIRGSASNNDGAQKASYTAPGVEGQANVLLDAMACAGVESDTLSYIEAHGTATDLGDAIEMLALTDAFRAGSNRKGFCAIGSVKTNIGHLETAAGVAGLIKTALALHHRQLPPSLHFEQPNPKINFADSPFYVNTRLVEWNAGNEPRRAGVSSFGIGSANAHVILEEAPERDESSAARPWQLLLLSARTEAALEVQALNLISHLKERPSPDDRYLADVAYTLKVGRKDFRYRLAAVCPRLGDAEVLEERLNPTRALTQTGEVANRQVVFMFPGLGDHYAGMGKDLYRTELTFKEIVDRGAETLRSHLGFDIRDLLYPPDGTAETHAVSTTGKLDFRRMIGRSQPEDENARRLNRTDFIQPSTFVIEYALAHLWMQWGIRPQAMIGYSLGEYVAACLAGVFSFEDALSLVAGRARMIQELPEGAMLAVPLAESEVTPLLEKRQLSLSAVNGPSTCVLSGPVTAVEAAERELAERQVLSRRLQTSHAFHSAMMDVLAEPLTEFVKTINLNEPRIPYISNVTGTWVTAEQATDPAYWAVHMCGAVRFSEGIQELAREPGRVLLEIGPGQGLTSFVKQHSACGDEAASLAFASLPGAYDTRSELAFLLETLGKLWVAGQNVDWAGFYATETRRRVPLPTYPFERQRYWVDRPGVETAGSSRRVTLEKLAIVADWFYLPVWKPSPATNAVREQSGSRWLVFVGEHGLGSSIADRLMRDGRSVMTVKAGESFVRSGEHEFTINPRRLEDYTKLISACSERGNIGTIVHTWTVSALKAEGNPVAGEAYRIAVEERAVAVEDPVVRDPVAEDPVVRDPVATAPGSDQELGFYSLLFLAQAIGRQSFSTPTRIEVVASGLHSITGVEDLSPENATLIGPARVIPQEFPNIICRCIDVVVPASAACSELDELAEQIVHEFSVESDEILVAYRDGNRWVQDYEPRHLEAAAETPKLRERGVYLITGAFGGLGLVLAEHLARKVNARLVLIGRTPLPPRDEWPTWQDSNGTDDPSAERIRAALRLEELGAEVMAFGADVGDESQMRSVADEAKRRFGTIHGVVHLAGIPGGGIIQLKTREMAERIISPKVKGALVIDKLFRDEPLDFLVLYSSIASILGEFGQADYCGANAFLDAFAHRNARRGGPHTVVINWDVWQEVGLAVYTQVPQHLRQWRQEMLSKGILNSEGTDAFDRILSSGLSQVIVSAQDLKGRIELGKSFTGENFLLELQKAAPESRTARRFRDAGDIAASGDFERRVATVWQRILGSDQIGVNDNFFDLGGNSLVGLQLVSELSRDLGMQIAPVTLFEFPTVSALARHLNPEQEEAGVSGERDRRKKFRERSGPSEIAVIGMAGRFPGAPSLETYWRNLCEGVESLTFFTDEELLASGVPRSVLENSRYVKAGAILEDTDSFDAGLFGFSPREAEVTDPQHRIFLECAWEVLERAGYDPLSYRGSIGVFAGSNLSTYLLRLHADPKVRESVNMLQAILGNDKDSLTTMVSYKLNLRGPSIAVQTFCSTSLVAVHMASQSLRDGECDMALAGGIRVVVPDRQGYMYEQGGLAPIDGHTRPFDAGATGSILANGVGIVCLKRLEDALADGDHIHAVIKGSAINNDGSLKAGYTAPSVTGQAAAIMSALDDAGVAPESVSYVEAHGSATELGDPIEFAALTKAFGSRTDNKSYCGIGSVKSNFGHLDRAAGVAALIKTVMALEHRVIPPTINFAEPNPQIDFANSPFYVNTALSEWNANGGPLRAGVNSLGMGGTNAHVIVEEAPAVEPSTTHRSWQLLVLSGRTETALDEVTSRLGEYFQNHVDLNLADVAYTLQVGRRALEFRRFAVCRDWQDASIVLVEKDPRRTLTGYREEGDHSIVFMFPGLGGQYVNMARGIYDSEPTFRSEVDRCCELLQPYLGFDLRKELYPAESERDTDDVAGSAPSVDLRKMLRRGAEKDDSTINRTSVSQPLLFVIEYALARLWIEWGIRPSAMVGYSLGEYVAACLAGVISLEDSLKLVAERSRMIESLPPGSLLAVGLSEENLLPLLGDELSMMAVNGPEQCVVSGPPDAIETLQSGLDSMGIAYRRLQASHAFHSKMMQPIFDSVVELTRSVELRPPQIPYISNVTGTWVREEDAIDPTYWARHMCQPVRFSEGVQELIKDWRRVLLEVGPPMLSSLILQHPTGSGDEQLFTLNLLRHSYETQPDLAYALQALGKLWLLGVQPDWEGFHSHERRRRVLLPTYPFQRQRYWIDAQLDRQYVGSANGASHKEWFYVPSWKRTPTSLSLSATYSDPGQRRWWILMDESGLGNHLAELLESVGGSVTRVRVGAAFKRTAPGSFVVCPTSPEDFLTIINEESGPPDVIVHLWGLPETREQTREDSCEAQWREQGALGLITLAQALGEAPGNPSLTVWVVSDQLHEVTGDEILQPMQASLLGACTAIGRKLPNLAVRNLDVSRLDNSATERQRLVTQILNEMINREPERVIAYRGRHRWVPTIAIAKVEETNGREARSSGELSCMVINGLGPLGSSFCEHLARVVGNRLILVEPSGLPEPEMWDEWLANDKGEGLITARIRRIKTIKEHTEVITVFTDLSDPDKVRSLMAQLKDSFGALCGVLYLYEPESLSATFETHAIEQRSSRGEVASLLVLDEALQDCDLAFRLLVSHTRANGVLSAADYALALSLDNLASNSARNGHQSWTSVTWNLSPASVDREILSEAIGRLFHLDGTPQVIVSPEPLADGWNKLDALMANSSVRLTSEPMSHYPRPSLRVEYAPPTTPAEQAIVEIWRELLGVDKIGVHDNFLDLGGDSLLAVRLISRLRDAFQQELPISLIFEASSVAELARAVEPKSQEGDPDLSDILEMVEYLSEEDVEQELLKRRQSLN